MARMIETRVKLPMMTTMITTPNEPKNERFQHIKLFNVIFFPYASWSGNKLRVTCKMLCKRSHYYSVTHQNPCILSVFPLTYPRSHVKE